jgi:hypothetical protein
MVVSIHGEKGRENCRNSMNHHDQVWLASSVIRDQAEKRKRKEKKRKEEKRSYE